MNLKNTAALIGVGLVLGLGIGVPSAKVFQGVKTVTKPVPTKITNGIPTQQMMKSFGPPAQVLTSSQQVTLPAGCALFAGKADASGAPKWLVVACPLSQ
jgi:hypothetical protein